MPRVRICIRSGLGVASNGAIGGVPERAQDEREEDAHEHRELEGNEQRRAEGDAEHDGFVALVAACAVASFFAIRERREWRSLIAPLLSTLGFIGFMLWLDAHTGERRVWFRVQTEAWGEGTSFGLTAIRRTIKAFSHPLTSPTNTITAVSVVTLVLLLWFLRTHRLPAAFNAYVAVVVLLMLLPSTVTARPRFIYTASRCSESPRMSSINSTGNDTPSRSASHRRRAASLGAMTTPNSASKPRMRLPIARPSTL